MQKGDFGEEHFIDNIDPIDERRHLIDFDYRAFRGLIVGMTKPCSKSGVRARMNERRWLLVVGGAYAVLAGAAVTVPRLAAHGKEAWVAIANAAVSFLLLGTLALVASVVALVMTVRAWKRLPVGLRAAGLSPVILSVAGGLVFVAALESRRDDAPASSPIPPKKLTAPAAVDILKENEAEQDGADQPATASESKPKGKEKPQAESEGVSQ